MHNNACGCLNTVQTSPSETYTTTYSYDAASRKDGVVFPSGYAVKYHYNGIGHFESITDTHGHELYRTVKTTAMGQTERFVMGGNMVSKREYHAEKQTLTHILTANGENILQDLWYDYDGFGNLAVRKDTLRDLEERFTYDHLNRLTGIRLNGSPTGDMGYDPYGRMKDKVADGSRVFFSAVYDLTSKPHAIDAAKTLPGVFPAERQRIDYTCFDKVKTIEEGDKTLEYTYGYDRQRTGMTEHANGVVRTKRYAGGCEFVTRTENDTTTQVVYTFLTGPTGVFAVVEKSNGEENVHYVLKDHLGSWTTITDADGVVEHEQSFDAWGNMRDPDSWTGTVAQQPMFDRGFTGHEHMAAFGLINMNGRCYDPLTSCFLSVDAYVQSPDNSQSFNRYSYCQNNPLRYTDPSGWQMVGGMRPRHQGFYDKWGDYYSCPIYRPRDFGLLQLSDVNPDIAWMEANEMHGGSSFGSNYTVDGKGGDDVKCSFGTGDPNSVKVMGPGACVFASMGLICKRLGKWNMNPTFWKEKEEEYFTMKNLDGENDENNHGYINTNLVDFVQWVGREENVEFVIKPILLGSIPDAYGEKAQVLVLVGLENEVLIQQNGWQTGHAAVVNEFIMRTDGAIQMKFGDPSPQRIMPLIYQNNNPYAWPNGFSAWGFYQININKP